MYVHEMWFNMLVLMVSRSFGSHFIHVVMPSEADSLCALIQKLCICISQIFVTVLLR